MAGLCSCLARISFLNFESRLGSLALLKIAPRRQTFSFAALCHLYAPRFNRTLLGRELFLLRRFPLFEFAPLRHALIEALRATVRLGNHRSR